MSKESLIGSAKWLEHVFATPPVRALKGRSKHTQFHQMWSSHLGRHVGAQGRNELMCALMLEYFSNLGLIHRFKEQPFRCSIDDFGAELVPDFLAVGSRGEIYVVEAKSARYVTAEIAGIHNRNRDAFRQREMQYVVWTDRDPFTSHVRRALVEMFRHQRAVSEQDLQTLQHIFADVDDRSFAQLYDRGLDQAAVLGAAWRGLLHFKIDVEFGPETLFSRHPIMDIRAAYFGKRHGGSWWDSLSPVEIAA